jgi:hypothetical protein
MERFAVDNQRMAVANDFELSTPSIGRRNPAIVVRREK